MEYVIKDVFDRHMKNEAPENIELMFRRVYSSGFSQRPDPTVIGAFSGLEMACLDILGKSFGKPIYSILGGCMQNKIRSYTYLYPLEPRYIYPVAIERRSLRMCSKETEILCVLSPINFSI